MTKELNGRQEQGTLLLFHMPPLRVQAFKHLLDMRAVLSSGLAIDQDVIHIHKNTLVQEVSKQQVHAALEVCRCVLEAKSHDVELKGPITTCKGCLKPIRLLYRNLMIAIPQIKFAEVLCTTQPCKHLINPWQGPRIRDGVAVQRSIINAHAQTTPALLLCEQYGCTVRATAWHNPTRLKQFVHLLAQLLQLKIRKWIQLASSWLHCQIHQRYGK